MVVDSVSWFSWPSSHAVGSRKQLKNHCSLRLSTGVMNLSDNNGRGLCLLNLLAKLSCRLDPFSLAVTLWVLVGRGNIGLRWIMLQQFGEWCGLDIFVSWGWKMLNRPKKLIAAQKFCCNFFPQSALCPSHIF